MRGQYRSRGRPDYGGGGGGPRSGSSRYGGGPSDYYRGGGRGSGRGQRYMRRSSYDHHRSSSSHGHRSQQQHYFQHEHHHHHHHQHREEIPVAAPSDGQCSHRVATPPPLLPELEYRHRHRREAASELKAESPPPSENRRKRKRRHRSPTSPVLSNISSATSLYVAEEEVEGEEEEEDSDDINASPDYDEVTSGEESGEEEEEIEEIMVVKHKKRKKDKKKKDRERRQRKKEKKRKKEILEERICPPEHDVAQKEIFSSGKNILVSVSFDDEGMAAGAEAEAAAYKAYRKSKKKKSSRKRSKSGTKLKEEFNEEYPSTSQKRKRNFDDVKPVAIIDLERSPGKQVISSPKEVIVLSDEEVAGGSGKKKNKSGADQVGPNTPPEPAPKSPESYDPFDPTKSPMDSLASGVNLGSISTVSYPEHHQYQHHHHHHRQRILKDIASPDLNFADDGILDLHPSSPMDQLTPRPHYRHSPLKPHRTTPAKKAVMPQPATGWDDTLDDGDISPYSPRSSDCDDHMFDPPTDANGGAGSSSAQPKTIALTVDNLRKVFGNDKNTLYGDLRRPNEAVQLVDEMYKPQKVTMEMLDDIPNSAVDLQIKEKLIQKLQRQDRIIEEVKIFLKPHFNKKRISKEEYKNIMKKSVPKICHSRSGEINPLKIQNLILAYVKNAMAKRKMAMCSGNAIVSSTTAVT